MTRIQNKLKQRLIAKHSGHWIRMAKTKSGSRCLDTIYTNANVANKVHTPLLGHTHIHIHARRHTGKQTHRHRHTDSLL